MVGVRVGWVVCRTQNGILFFRVYLSFRRSHDRSVSSSMTIADHPKKIHSKNPFDPFGILNFSFASPLVGWLTVIHIVTIYPVSSNPFSLSLSFLSSSCRCFPSCFVVLVSSAEIRNSASNMLPMEHFIENKPSHFAFVLSSIMFSALLIRPRELFNPLSIFQDAINQIQMYKY